MDCMIIDCDNLAYIDLDEDEIMHWKYIKRVKLPNGKYRYYYDQSELDNMQKQIDENRKKSLENVLDASASKTNRDLAGKRMDELENLYDETGKSQYAEGYLKNKQQYEELDKAASYHADQAKQYSKKAETLVKQYNTKKVVSFAERTISKGVVAVANFFSKLFGQKNGGVKITSTSSLTK